MTPPERIDARPPASNPQPAVEQAPLRPWLLAWFGLPVIGIANGAIRDVTYKRAVTERTAHQVSTGTLLLLMTAYMRTLNRRWPLRASRTACTIGGIWAAFTIAFEFGFGHYVTKDSWTDLLHAYDITGGQIWAAVPIWTALGPEIIRRTQDRRRTQTVKTCGSAEPQ